MTDEGVPKLQEGDKVRDRAELGGTVLETWGNGVKVRWHSMMTSWIDRRFLRRAVTVMKETK